MSTLPRALVPEDLHRRTRPATPLVRAVLAEARAVFTPERDAARVARKTWPDDKATLALLTRAASSFATTTDAAWAAPLAPTTIVAELLTNLGPTSAGSQLLRRGITLTFDGYNQIKVPGITASANYAGFVGQGANIPVRQLAVSAGVTLEARKFASVVALSREMIESGNAEALVRAVLVDSVAIALDVALLGSTAGDANRPPGLLNNIVALTPTAGGGSQAMLTDLAALAAGPAAVGGLDLAYVCAPSEAVKLTFAMGAQFKLPIIASGGIPPKTVICLALPALVSATDPQPQLESARDAVLHFDDASPSDLGTPSKSMFQIDSVAIRLTQFVAWGLRATGGASWMQNVTW
jgi:Phage capsid family